MAETPEENTPQVRYPVRTGLAAGGALALAVIVLSPFALPYNLLLLPMAVIAYGILGDMAGGGLGPVPCTIVGGMIPAVIGVLAGVAAEMFFDATSGDYAPGGLAVSLGMVVLYSPIHVLGGLGAGWLIGKEGTG